MVGPPPPAEGDGEGDEEQEDLVGPAMPKAKKRKVLEQAERRAAIGLLVISGWPPAASARVCLGLRQALPTLICRTRASATFNAVQVLEFEQQYLVTLPSAQMYERSFMHRDTVNNVAVRRCHHLPLGGRRRRSVGLAGGYACTLGS